MFNTFNTNVCMMLLKISIITYVVLPVYSLLCIAEASSRIHFNNIYPIMNIKY